MDNNTLDFDGELYGEAVPEKLAIEMEDSVVEIQSTVTETVVTTQNPNGKRTDAITKKIIIDTEDILAIFCGIVALIIAIGIVFKTVDVVSGGVIIGGLLSASAVAEIIKIKRKPSDQDSANEQESGQE